VKILIIAGTTASGKTKISVMAAHKIGGEIVNADAMQVYRGMDIGTAKPTIEERECIPHHMFDVADPGENYSVSRYIEQASEIIDDILARGKAPILVGGTGLYIDSLLYGREFADTNPDLRAKLESLTNPHAELEKIDPDSANKFHPNDTRRIIRALEVYYLTGKTISEVNLCNQAKKARYPYKEIILTYKNRKRLYDCIDKRVLDMLECGLIREVQTLLNKGVKTQAIGYKEIAAALNGECTLDEAICRVQQASRNYAKRQLTWFRRSPNAKWIEWDDEPDIDSGLRQVLDFWYEKSGYEN